MTLLRKLLLTLIFLLGIIPTYSQENNKLLERFSFEIKSSKYLFRESNTYMNNAFTLGTSLLFKQSNTFRIGADLNTTIPGLDNQFKIDPNLFILIGDERFYYKTGFSLNTFSYLSGIKYYFLKEKLFLSFDYKLLYVNSFTYSHFLSNYIFRIGFKIK